MTHFPYEHLLPHLDAHYQGMPPVAAMQVSIAGFDGDCLRLDAPLDRNVNDKGCAFGGSLASLMTLACWGLATMRIQGAGMEADVFVADSQVRYLAPLYGDLQAKPKPRPNRTGMRSSPRSPNAAARGSSSSRAWPCPKVGTPPRSARVSSPSAKGRMRASRGGVACR